MPFSRDDVTLLLPLLIFAAMTLRRLFRHCCYCRHFADTHAAFADYAAIVTHFAAMPRQRAILPPRLR